MFRPMLTEQRPQRVGGTESWIIKSNVIITRGDNLGLMCAAFNFLVELILRVCIYVVFLLEIAVTSVSPCIYSDSMLHQFRPAAGCFCRRRSGQVALSIAIFD